MLEALPLLTVLSSVPTPSIAFAALALTLLGIIVVYLFSKVVNSPQLEAFMREEFAHFVLTAVIFAFWLAAYSLFLGIASYSVCGGSACDLMSVAYYSLTIIKSRLFQVYAGLIAIESVVGFLSTVGVSIPLPLANMIMSKTWIGMSPLSGLGILSNTLITLIESVGFLIGLVIGRQFLLDFFSAVAPYVMLPLGLAMRAFPFTRRTGSSLIALAFAVYFIFPLSVILSHGMIFGTPSYNPDLDTATISLSAPTFAKMCDDPTGNYSVNTSATAGGLLSEEASVGYESWWFKSKEFVKESWNFITGRVDGEGGFVDYFKDHYGVGSLAVTILTGGKAALTPTTFGHVAFYFSLRQIPLVMRFAVLVMVTFVLEIIITVTGYRTIAHLIGGELEILGLTKVV